MKSEDQKISKIQYFQSKYSAKKKKVVSLFEFFLKGHYFCFCK